GGGPLAGPAAPGAGGGRPPLGLSSRPSALRRRLLPTVAATRPGVPRPDRLAGSPSRSALAGRGVRAGRRATLGPAIDVPAWRVLPLECVGTGDGGRSAGLPHRLGNGGGRAGSDRPGRPYGRQVERRGADDAPTGLPRRVGGDRHRCTALGGAPGRVRLLPA